MGEAGTATLSGRERIAEVARLGRTLTAERIAERLGVTVRTVERDRAHLAQHRAQLEPESYTLGAPDTESDSPDWRHRAACLGEDPEMFFPVGTTGPAERQVEEAKAVCRRCAVTNDCLSWAMETGQDHGVWGGTDEGERRLLKRREPART